ncbi:hypothetical protein GCM10027059_14590 [Myceligenerans halotolerans]
MDRTRLLVTLAALTVVGVAVGLIVWQPWGVPVSVRLAAWRLESIDGVVSADATQHRMYSAVHDERSSWSVTEVVLEPGASPERAGEIAWEVGAAFPAQPRSDLHLVADDENGVRRVWVAWARPTRSEHVVDAYTLVEAGAEHVYVYVTGGGDAVGYTVQVSDLSEWERFDELARQLELGQFELTVAPPVG